MGEEINNKMTKKAGGIIFFLVAAMLTAVGAAVFAAQSYKVDAGNTTAINEWGICRRVTNAGGYPSVFVPTNTSAEWTTFI